MNLLLKATRPLVLLGFSAVALAEGSANLRIMPGFIQYESTSPLAAASQPSSITTLTQELTLQWRHGGLSFQGTLTDQRSSDNSHQTDGVVNELFYDTPVGAFDLTIGKKILGWGVGYGYRPLDQIQRQQRLSLAEVTQEGTPIISFEHFTETGAVGLTYANHIQWNNGSPHRGDEAWALRYYGLHGNWDLQLQLHHNRDDGGSVGGGFSWVGGEAVEFHGSVISQQYYNDVRLNLPYNAPAGSPITRIRQEDGLKALVGMSWSGESGYSVMAEYWYDETALNTRQWDDILALITQLPTLASDPAFPIQNVSALIDQTLKSERPTNLLQDNLFLRLSYNGDSYDPAIELLYAPEARGGSVTLRLQHEYSNQQLNFGVRQLFGPGDSLFAKLPEQRALFAAWEFAYGF